MDFRHRNTAQELMDDPDISEQSLCEVFEDINRANSLLNGNGITINALENLMKIQRKKSYTILDVGCGDGTLLRQVVLWGKERGLRIKAVGVDLSEKALNIAKRKSDGFPEIQFVCQNVLDTSFNERFACDIALCTLTLHHLRDEHLPVFLGQLVKLSCMGVIINDLERSRWAYYLFKVFSAIFIRTDIAKNDGLLSIASGFTKKELEQFSKNIKAMGHEIRWKWAFRYVWVIKTQRLTEPYAERTNYNGSESAAQL